MAPNFVEMLLNAINFLEEASTNEAITKEELCKSMETRLSLLIGKAIASPTGPSFCIFAQKERAIGSATSD